MKKIISTLLASCCLTSLIAQEVVVKGPDEKLQLVVSASPAEKPSYSITYNGKTMLEKSPLGMNTNIGEFAKGMKLTREIISEIEPGQSIGIFIGPEGGFEEEEVAKALEIGAHAITLGKRILRTETAGLTLLAVLMLQLDNE